MLRARRQKVNSFIIIFIHIYLKELEDKQREAEEKAKRDAEAEEKAKQEAAAAPPVPAEPKQSIKDRGAALNLRVGTCMIPHSLTSVLLLLLLLFCFLFIRVSYD